MTTPIERRLNARLALGWPARGLLLVACSSASGVATIDGADDASTAPSPSAGTDDPEDAVFAFPELTLGTYVGGGVTLRLPELVGLARARELLFTGRRFTGAEAAAWGLALRAVPGPELDSAVTALTDQLARTAPVPAGLLKAQLGRVRQLDEALHAEVDGLLRCMATADWAEGIAAHAQRRAPVFEGR
jgi:enoyl-CoA hydratase